MSNLKNLRVSDPVISNVVLGYAQADSIAPFIAPVVPVTQRAGKVIKFTKEQFVIVPTQRAPGEEIKRISTNYTSENYTLNQHAASGKITEEEYEEALNSDARIDLRAAAALRAAQAVMQSWEKEVIDTVTDASLYEASCTSALAGTDKFSDPNSDPDVLVTEAKEAVRAQVGLYPNSAVISPKVYNALKNHPLYRDRIKYTSSGSINLEMLAQWLDLPRGIRIASRVYLDQATGELKDFMGDNMLLFYNPEGEIGAGFNPVNGANRAVPAFGYTYSLQGYPISTPERYDENSRSYLTDVISEQSLVLTSLGATGKSGAGFLFTAVL